MALGFLGVATAIGLDALWELDLRSLAQLAVLGGAMSHALASVWARRTRSGLAPQVAAAGMLTGPLHPPRQMHYTRARKTAAR